MSGVSGAGLDDVLSRLARAIENLATRRQKTESPKHLANGRHEHGS